MTLGDRILRRLKVLGMSQSALARAVGVSPQAIHKIAGGTTTQTAHIYAIAKALQTTPEYLAGETDDPLPAAAHDTSREFGGFPAEFASTAKTESLVGVREIDLTFGMGATYMDVPVTTQVRQFSREWLRQYTHADPDHLFFAQGIGNSMEPYIHSHDLLLIDTSQNSIRLSDQVWAVAYANCGSIKRIRPMADGSVKMMSDNPTVSDEVAHDGELHVIGRVVAIIRRI